MRENSAQGTGGTQIGPDPLASTSSGQLGKRLAPFVAINFPDPQFRKCSHASNNSLVWFVQGLPRGQAVLVASSRISTKLDELDDWFAALRTLAVRLDPDQHFFLTAEGITTEPYVRHIARRFGFPLVVVRPWDDQATVSFETYCKEITSSRSTDLNVSLIHSNEPESEPAEPEVYQAYCCQLSTAVDDLNSAIQLRQALEQREATFQPDKLLIEIAAQCYLLSVRPRGTVHLAALTRLAASKDLQESESSHPESSRTWVLVSEFTKPSTQAELQTAGAIGWWLYEDTQDATSQNQLSCIATVSQDSIDLSQPLRNEIPNQSPILRLDEFPAERFLIHWTRYRVGPWPEQSDEEWLDDLLFQADRRKHGPAFALRRILATSQILASRKLTRDDQPVVCLSNRSLREIDGLRTFRQHLGRWDFVPFGIAIDREWLSSRGARPVIYGDSAVWESLAEHDRPFFQLAQSSSGKVDWTIEQEWRWLGNLNLRRLPLACVAAFVPSMTDAGLISSVCPWPVVVLNGDFSQGQMTTNGGGKASGR